MVRLIGWLCLMAILAAPPVRADCVASYATLRATLDKAGITQAQFLATCLPPASAKAAPQNGAALEPDPATAAGMLLRGLKPPGGAIAMPFASFAS